ncbi:MAG: phosphatase PAP2 family protein, partial [Myxococcota bacterium]
MTREARWVWSTTAAFLALWVAAYGGASALSAHVPWRIGVALPGEEHLPLVRAASIPYLSLDLLLLALPLTLRRWSELAPVAGALAAQTLVAAAVFVALPVRTEPWLELPPTDPLFALADAMNLERNYLPSLHVSYALTAASVLAGRAAGPARAAYAAWGLMVAASTVLLRQHYLADVAAGAALAW